MGVATVHADLKVPADGPKYFDNALDEIQGALQDTIRAGLDLETMESRLQSVADASSFFFRAESAVEYAVASDAYKNLWNNGGSSVKYVLGNTNTLCDGGKKIVNFKECQSAATSLGRSFDGNIEDDTDFPGGCYSCCSNLNTKVIYFNENSGMARFSSSPVCREGKNTS